MAKFVRYNSKAVFIIKILLAILVFGFIQNQIMRFGMVAGTFIRCNLI